MTIYTVLINREVQLVFEGIEANSYDEAAAIACDKHPAAADDIDQGDGETFSAQVDVAGDEDFSHRVTIEFEAERQRKAAAKLLAALTYALEYLKANDDGEPDVASRIAAAEVAIAEADAAGIPSLSITTQESARFDFTYEADENPDRAYVMVDGKYDVSLKRTGEGITVDVYPKDWIDPIDTLTVWDDEVAELEPDTEEARP